MKPIPYEQSKWYNLSVNYKNKKPTYFPGFYIPWLYESLDSVPSQSQVEKQSKLSRWSMRHQAFHYHRIRQHLRTSYSLYTQL